jgi:hypothetical protein
MPTYPTSPTLTVEALLKQPVLISRALTALASQRFVADRILARGTPEQVAGGVMNYQRSESIFTDRPAEEVGVGAEFPSSGWSEALLQAAVKKYGLEVPIYYESVRRNARDQIARGQKKIANGVVKFVDSKAMSMITSDAAVSTTTAAAAWSASATTIVSDIVNGLKVIRDQNEGFEADTMILNPAQYLFLLTNATLQGLLPREGGAPTAPIVTGRASPILGLSQILESPVLPAGTVLLLESNIIGTIADEQPQANEGYSAYDPNGTLGQGPGNEPVPANPHYPSNFAPVYVKVRNEENKDKYVVRGARFPAMAILEPKSAFKITSA